MDDFQITLKGDGISVDRTVSSATARAILDIVLAAPSDVHSHGFPTQKPTASATASITKPSGAHDVEVTPLHASIDKPLSLREFVNDIEPRTNAQIILAIAQYLSKHEGQDRFRREAIKSKFASAGETVPKNFTRDFQTAIDKGWIGDDPQNRDLFYVTRTGEQQIAKGFKARRN